MTYSRSKDWVWKKKKMRDFKICLVSQQFGCVYLKRKIATHKTLFRVTKTYQKMVNYLKKQQG